MREEKSGGIMMLLKACPQVEPAPSKKPSREMADVFRLHGKDYHLSHQSSFAERKVMHNIENCRTASMGGHIEECDLCGFRQPSYNSCGDRHCPKCQTMAKEKWLSERIADLLPTSYFHLVFTLPHDLNPLILCNKEKMLDLLFEAVSETLQAFALDPEWRLNGELGIIAVLHTWSQTLLDHFHLHCLVPSGALSVDRSRWAPSRKTYLFGIGSLRKAFRNLYLGKLEAAFKEGLLIFPGRTAPLKEGFRALMRKTRSTDWVAYAKAPFAGPEQVIRYLGRYTHRVALSNERIKNIEGGAVTFTYRDRQNGNKVKEMTLDAHEFIRRFLLHVLPKGFVKIRYFGFLSHRKKSECIPLIRALLDSKAKIEGVGEETVQEMMLRLTGIDIGLCPHCRKGRMVRIEKLPKAFHPYQEAKGAIWDS